MDEWRSVLYPLGFLAALAFGARFIIQWIQSEKAQKSLVPRSFWQLSIIGNLLLMVHSFIQIQYHVCIVQVCNTIISWRNLNLMQTKHPPISLRMVIFLLIGSIMLVTSLFALQDWMIVQNGDWFRIPTAPWQASSTYSISIFWHLLGTIAYGLFSSRFWIQWWYAEKARASTLPVAFWWLSLIGAFLSIVYFARINDLVNLIGPLLGIIPYARNLMLIQKNRTTVEQL